MGQQDAVAAVDSSRGRQGGTAFHAAVHDRETDSKIPSSSAYFVSFSKYNLRLLTFSVVLVVEVCINRPLKIGMRLRAACYWLMLQDGQVTS